MSSTVLVLIMFSTGTLLMGAMEARPNGAPTAACESMTPGHGATPQPNENSPYITVPLLKNVVGNTLVPLILDSMSADNPFKGFLAMAFDVSKPNGPPVGTFELISDGAQLIDCLGGTKNAVTHLNNNRKNYVMVIWVPPAGFNGQIFFKVTYVKDFNTYWVKTNSTTVDVTGSLLKTTGGSTATRLHRGFHHRF